MTQERFSWENCRSRPMEGSATLTIDASSTTTNWASARSARASHFRSGATVGLKVVVSRDGCLARPKLRECSGPAHRHFGASSGAAIPYDGIDGPYALSELEFRFRLSRYGIDVPLVKPYIHLYATTRR